MDEFKITKTAKKDVFEEVRKYLTGQGFKLVQEDIKRPWGFFFYIDEAQTDRFIKKFYNGVNLEGIDSSLPLQPKILAFEPGQKNSWQYHFRRAEIWRCLSDDCMVVMGPDDNEPESIIIKKGDIINFRQGIRHRGGGTDKWALVAEIWQHTDPNNPSNEDDIVRLQDDYGRAN
ncbi:MAG TPA: hypothetical protein VFB03_00105 [Candidatus Saccharimonadales bacterium]|nr:hypothetical protein [Candidatus Saccharimonadales bacterium]